MKMKNLTIGVASAVVLTTGLILGGCGGDQSKNASTDTSAVTDSVEDTKTENNNIDQNEAANSFNTAPNITEPVVLEDETGLKFTIKDIEYSNNVATLNVDIENNSDVELNFSTEDNSVNNYMIDQGYFSTTVAPGKKALDTISFSYDELSLYGITEIAEVQIGLNVRDSENNDIYSGRLKVVTDINDSYDYSADTYKESIQDPSLTNKFGYSIDYFSDEVLYEHDGIRVTSAALITNSNNEKSIFVEVENNTSNVVQTHSSNIAVNDVEFVSAGWSTDLILPEKSRILQFYLSSIMGDVNIVSALNITEINNFSFNLNILNSDGEEIIEANNINITMADNNMDVSGEEIYNQNDIKIINKGVVTDEYDDIHILLLIENNNANTIHIADEYDTFSVNGYMTDAIIYSVDVASGKYGLMDIELYLLDDIDITTADEITNAEITLNIEDSNGNDIASPTVSMTFNGESANASVPSETE